MVFVALALTLFQDGSARALADAITDQDPAASFRAISDLVELADTRRAEVEKEAVRLPAFYREVLLSELKAKRELGERFGRGDRINLKGEGRRVWDYVDELGRHPGLAIDTYPYQREHFAKQPMDVDLKNVWPLQALVTLCDRSNQRVGGGWQGKLTLGDRGDGMVFRYVPTPWFFYRNIAIPQPGPRWRKLVDFSGPPRWRAIFRISPTLGPETQVVMWKDLKVLEAAMDDGTELKLAAPEDTAIPGYEWQSPGGAPEEMEIAFDAGERKGTISRLRCSVVGRVPKEWRRYVLDKLDGPNGGKAEDEDFEVTVRDPLPEDFQFGGYQPEFRIRPKKMPHAHLVNVPVTVQLRWDPNTGPGWTGFKFTGKGESTLWRLWNQGTLRPAKDDRGNPVRRLLSVEVFIPMELQDRPIFMEFRDIPLK